MTTNSVTRRRNTENMSQIDASEKNHSQKSKNFSYTNLSLLFKGRWEKNHTSNLLDFSLPVLLQRD